METRWSRAARNFGPVVRRRARPHSIPSHPNPARSLSPLSGCLPLRLSPPPSPPPLSPPARNHDACAAADACSTLPNPAPSRSRSLAAAASTETGSRIPGSETPNRPTHKPTDKPASKETTAETRASPGSATERLGPARFAGGWAPSTCAPAHWRFDGRLPLSLLSTGPETTYPSC